jgi:hypothetical protein
MLIQQISIFFEVRRETRTYLRCEESLIYCLEIKRVLKVEDKIKINESSYLKFFV